MMSLLSSKLTELKGLEKEELKVTNDDSNLEDQPQNEFDPYVKAKDLIEQFRDKMKELEIKQMIKVQYFEDSLNL